MCNVYYNSNVSNSIYVMAFRLGMAVDLCSAYMLRLVSVTLTLMEGHSGPIKKVKISVELSRKLSKQ